MSLNWGILILLKSNQRIAGLVYYVHCKSKIKDLTTSPVVFASSDFNADTQWECVSEWGMLTAGFELRVANSLVEKKIVN